MRAQDAVSENISSIIGDAHLLSVSEDGLTDAQVCKQLMEEYDLGNWGDLGSSFMEDVQKAVRMTRTADS